MDWLKRSFRQSLLGADGNVPKELSVLLGDTLHGQTADEFRDYLLKEFNTILWLLPAGCTDEVQPIDAGYGRRLKFAVGQQLDMWLEHEKNSLAGTPTG